MQVERNKQGNLDSDAFVAVEKLITSGTFSLDGGTWDVDNNVWIPGNDKE